MALKQISSGAESIIYQDKDSVVKDRISKNYRIQEIDTSLRNSRTKREAKILEKLSKLKFSDLNFPKLIKTDANKIVMEFIPGMQLKKLLDLDPKLARLVGSSLMRLHDNDIIHADLTTSNMIVHEKKLYLIDFGLSFFSKKIEDKAVDIHLFKQALESKHYRVADVAFKFFLESYNPKDKKEVLKRLDEVETRGRYKEKI